MSRETYTTTVVRHKMVKEYYPDGSRLEECAHCTLVQAYEPGEGFSTLTAGSELACTVEVERCICFRSHTVGHAKCYGAGEHICGPCECDCHYED